MTESTDLVAADRPVEPNGQMVHADFREMAMSATVEQMERGLAEYSDRRKTFRDWLLSKLVQGVHYGFPPGTEPKLDSQGRPLVWMKGSESPLDPKQWRLKPSFYKAGADFICDLMNVRPKYEADNGAWQMLGSSVGTVVYACQLISKSKVDVVMGEGRGSATVTPKKKGDPIGSFDINKAVKMAMKSAKVSAVLETYGLADLFSQDLEDMTQTPPEHDNPPENDKAPKAQSRDNRITKDEFVSVAKKWLAMVNPAGDKAEQMDQFKAWAQQVCGREFRAGAFAEWTKADLAKCLAQLEPPSGDDNYGE